MSMSTAVNVTEPVSDSCLHDGFYDSSDASRIMRELDSVLEYVPRSELLFPIYGKQNQLPRDKAFYGDVDEHGNSPLYRYGGDTYPEVKAWPTVLKEVRDKLYQTTGQYCNHVVVNQYRDGHDHIGFHVDKTRDFVPGTNVLTVSFGATRILRVKPITSFTKKRKREDAGEKRVRDKTKKKPVEHVDVELTNGSLFILGNNTNEFNKHSIVKKTNKDAVGRRISLTFRSIATMRRAADDSIVESHYDCSGPVRQLSVPSKNEEAENEDAFTDLRGYFKSLITTNGMYRP